MFAGLIFVGYPPIFSHPVSICRTLFLPAKAGSSS
jgi:hypothetical protein